MGQLLRDLDSILERGAKQTSYKFAVLRAIAEWVIEHPLAPRHRVPVSWIAYRILPWYVHEGRYQVPHHKKSGPPAIENLATRIAQGAGGQPAFERAWLERRLPVSKELKAIRGHLVEQPLDKLRNLDGRQLDFYDVEGTKPGTQKLSPQPHKWRDLADFLNSDSCFVVLDEATTAELAPMRFLVRDVAIQHWATWSERLSRHRSIRPYILTALADPDASRLPTGPAKEAFRRLGLAGRCVLSGARVRKLDVDHFIPWSVYPRHDWTNLLPSERDVNQRQKRDRLPKLTDSLEDRLRKHFDRLRAKEDPWTVGRLDWPATNDVVREIDATLENLAQITGRPRFSPLA